MYLVPVIYIKIQVFVLICTIYYNKNKEILYSVLIIFSQYVRCRWEVCIWKKSLRVSVPENCKELISLFTGGYPKPEIRRSRRAPNHCCAFETFHAAHVNSIWKKSAVFFCSFVLKTERKHSLNVSNGKNYYYYVIIRRPGPYTKISE